MDIIDRAPRFTFTTKTNADMYCAKMRKMALYYDTVTINDILLEREARTVVGGTHVGYARSEIKKLKPVKEGSSWVVAYPMPSDIVRDNHGHWTTKNAQENEKKED